MKPRGRYPFAFIPFALMVGVLVLLSSCTESPTPTVVPTPLPTPTVTPTPIPTFQEQRTKVVQFLQQFNEASNNAEDAYYSADIEGELVSGDLLRFNAALTTALLLFQGYERLIRELVPPPDIPELVEA